MILESDLCGRSFLPSGCIWLQSRSWPADFLFFGHFFPFVMVIRGFLNVPWPAVFWLVELPADVTYCWINEVKSHPYSRSFILKTGRFHCHGFLSGSVCSAQLDTPSVKNKLAVYPPRSGTQPDSGTQPKHAATLLLESQALSRMAAITSVEAADADVPDG